MKIKKQTLSTWGVSKLLHIQYVFVYGYRYIGAHIEQGAVCVNAVGKMTLRAVN